MLVRAPGKLVLSGAYAVLSGATAVVTAVDRYVLADAARPAERVTPEVQAALGAEAAPWFDASELREGGEKLGLGSSAAILVASLGARLVLERGPLPDAELGRAVLAEALDAHARAQGGGSGVDVAAAALGGTLTFRRPGGVTAAASPEPPETAPVALPPGLHVETWWSGVPAVTSELVARVAELRRSDPARHARLLATQAAASERAALSLRSGDALALIEAWAEQRRALRALGEGASVPIVTAACEELGALAERAHGTAWPAGAGGGDVILYAGLVPSPPAFRALAAQERHRRIPLSPGARGVHVRLDGGDAGPRHPGSGAGKKATLA
jgi:phosphomevalonate kinase